MVSWQELIWAPELPRQTSTRSGRKPVGDRISGSPDTEEVRKDISKNTLTKVSLTHMLFLESID